MYFVTAEIALCQTQNIIISYNYIYPSLPSSPLTEVYYFIYTTNHVGVYNELPKYTHMYRYSKGTQTYSDITDGYYSR